MPLGQSLCCRLSSGVVLIGVLALSKGCDTAPPAPPSPAERLVQELRGADAQKRYGALAEVYELYHEGRLPQPVADAAVEAILVIQADAQQKQAWQSHRSKWEYLILMLDRDNRLSAEHWNRYVAAGGRTDPPGP